MLGELENALSPALFLFSFFFFFLKEPRAAEEQHIFRVFLIFLNNLLIALQPTEANKSHSLVLR